MIPESQTYLSQEARERRRWFIALLVLAALSYAAFVLVLLGPAWGHDAPSGMKYGWECCSSIDCRPAKRGEIRETPNGYQLVSTGEVVPYGNRRIKNSTDGQYHVCQQGGDFDKGRVLCIYVPPAAF